jgi:peptidoglycan hydrolase-like protein with peptidoglycan-binding domain
LRVLRLLYLQFGMILIVALAIAPASATTTHKTSHRTSTSKATTHKSSVHKTSTHKTSNKSKHGKRTVAKKSWKSKGQHGITSDRTREIQAALIREHYLDGEADGVWDTRTQEAMRNFQAKQGWQTKVLPDSRALIKLGLGPDHSDVLNPETAATSPFQPASGNNEKTAVSTMAPATSVVRAQ